VRRVPDNLIKCSTRPTRTDEMCKTPMDRGNPKKMCKNGYGFVLKSVVLNIK
jgi:hypothetical protein